MARKSLKTLLVIPLSMLSLSAGADAYDQPYAQVASGYRSLVRKEMPVAIASVDGIATRNLYRTDPLAPGRHRVQVYFAAGRPTTAKAFREVEIDMQPCTRYRIVANYRLLIHSDWEPKVYLEQIGECSDRFARRAQLGWSRGA